ncbi:MAG: SIS domain-containing protein [Anaerolineaceae bacterium]|nr:SIS domain-containing protein [Anaerolineaceae bacterium]
MHTLFAEISGQPQALRALIKDYQNGEGLARLQSLPALSNPIFTGMGASYHAAWIAAGTLNHMGVPAAAYEAIDLIHYLRPIVQKPQTLVYISQSGASGEVQPTLDHFKDQINLISLTNHLDNPLAAHAQIAIPLFGGEEEYIASKTYLNSLAHLWLLARIWTRQFDGSDLNTLLQVADAAQAILAQAEATGKFLVDYFRDTERLVFLGHGPHAATARQSAMMMSEWAKCPALSHGIGAFRHGFIETVDEKMGMVIITPPGISAASALELAHQLSGYGARVLLNVNGQLQTLDQYHHAEPAIDEFLSPILDILPTQIYSDALAKAKGLKPGFRYISKVVSNV